MRSRPSPLLHRAGAASLAPRWPDRHSGIQRADLGRPRQLEAGTSRIPRSPTSAVADARRARPRRRSRPPGLLPAAVDALHLAAADRAGAQREGAGRRAAGSEREAFLRGGAVESSRVPDAVRARIAALLRALGAPARDARLLYFGELVQDDVSASSRARERTLVARVPAGDAVRLSEGVRRAARGRAGRSRRRSLPIARPQHRYRRRSGLRRVHRARHRSSRSSRNSRIRRVLIVGPGLDLAPRTALARSWPAGKLSALGGHRCARRATALSRLDDLEVVGADINPRVVAHLRRRAHDVPPTLQPRQRDWRLATTVDALAGLPRLLRGARPRHRRQGTPAAPGRPWTGTCANVRVGAGAARALSADTARHRHRAAPAKAVRPRRSRPTSCPTSTTAS